jgi:hypothetical protein
MMPIRNTLAGLCLAAALVPSARAACVSPAEATIHLPARPGPLLVEARLDGRPARFVLDTGAERSVLSGAGEARLGLRPDAWTSTALRGIGGISRHSDAAVASLELGADIPLARRLGPVRSLPVVPGLQIEGDGLLGADLLAGQDLELTRGGLTLILHRPSGCAGLSPLAALPELFPWAEAVTASLAVRPGLFIIPVRVGGTLLRALVDTGAAVSIISPAAAARVAPGATTPGAGTPRMARGVGPALVALRLRDFGPVTLQGGPHATPIAIGAGPLWVGALPPRVFDMVLGMDRLRALHLGLSHATGAVYVARLSATD